MNKVNQKGFSAVEGLLFVLVVIVVAALGWYSYSRMQDNKATSTNNSTTSATHAATTEDSKPKEEERTSLGTFSFVLPKEWSQLKKLPLGADPNNPSNALKLARYSFKPAAKYQTEGDDGITISNGEIYVIPTEKVNLNSGGTVVAQYSNGGETWKTVAKKKLLSQFSGIVAVYFGDGVDNQYSTVIDYDLIRGDSTIVISVQEAGNLNKSKEPFTDFGDSIGSAVKSNEFQEQVVKLFNSIK